MHCGLVGSALTMFRRFAPALLLLAAATMLGTAPLQEVEATDAGALMLQDSDSTAVLSSVAMALGEVGDRRSIDPLIKTLQDRERTFLAKAFAAVALGGIGDKDPLPWNTLLASGMNYMATVDTLTNGSTGVLDIL